MAVNKIISEYISLHLSGSKINNSSTAELSMTCEIGTGSPLPSSRHPYASKPYKAPWIASTILSIQHELAIYFKQNFFSSV